MTIHFDSGKILKINGCGGDMTKLFDSCDEHWKFCSVKLSLVVYLYKLFYLTLFVLYYSSQSM